MNNLKSILLLTLVLVAGCATSPFRDESGTISTVGPAHAIADPATVGERVVWGGRIAAIENRAEHTDLFVVSYPLDGSDRPRWRAEGGVRFVVRHPGYLEPLNYPPGRFVTVLGEVGPGEDWPVGEFLNHHAVVTGERIHLWPADPASWSPRVRFGVGVGIRL